MGIKRLRSSRFIPISLFFFGKRQTFSPSRQRIAVHGDVVGAHIGRLVSGGFSGGATVACLAPSAAGDFCAQFKANLSRLLR